LTLIWTPGPEKWFIQTGYIKSVGDVLNRVCLLQPLITAPTTAGHISFKLGIVNTKFCPVFSILV